MSSPKAARWLDLVAFLLNRRTAVTREDIFSKVSGYGERSPSPVEPAPSAARGGGGRGVRSKAGQGVRSKAEGDPGETARRMFERDKAELKALGIVIETVSLPSAEGDEPASGYRLKERDFYLPYFELTDRPLPTSPYLGLRRVQLSAAELELLDRATKRVAERSESGLAGAASSLRQKLAFDLPLAETDRESVIAAPTSSATRSALATLQEAVAQRTPVRCRYYSMGRDAVEDREIEPYGLFFSWSRWYAVARARDRDAVRVFRLDRLSNVTALRNQPAFERPKDFSIRRWIGRAPWDLSDREPVVAQVRFGFPESRWVLHQEVGRVVDPEKDDGSAVLEFDVRDANPFLRWLLTFGTQAEVLSPASLAKDLVDLRAKVAVLYEEKTA